MTPLLPSYTKKEYPKNASTFDRGVAGKNLGVHIAQNHFRRAAVVPREQVPPDSTLIIEQAGADPPKKNV